MSLMQNTTFQPIAPVPNVWTLALVVLALPPLTACSVSQVLLKSLTMTDPRKLSYRNEYLHHRNSFSQLQLLPGQLITKPFQPPVFTMLKWSTAPSVRVLPILFLSFTFL